MFKIFQRETHRELEPILHEMQMNAENNYRDATLQNLHELEEHFTRLMEAGKLNEKQKTHYSSLISHYKTEFKGFTHREQVGRW